MWSGAVMGIHQIPLRPYIFWDKQSVRFTICGILSSVAHSKGQWQRTRVLGSRLATPSPGSYILIWSLTLTKASGNPKGGSGRRPMFRPRAVAQELPHPETSLGLLMTPECLTWFVNQRQEAGPCVCLVSNQKHTGSGPKVQDRKAEARISHPRGWDASSLHV